MYRVSADGSFHDFAGFGDPSTPNNGNGGPAIKAPPSNFLQLATDLAGNVYTEEESLNSNNRQLVILRIGADGIINVIAGTPTGGSQSDGPALQSALFSGTDTGLLAGGGTVTSLMATNSVRSQPSRQL